MVSNKSVLNRKYEINFSEIKSNKKGEITTAIKMSKNGSSTEFQYSQVPIQEKKDESGYVEIPSTYGLGIRHVQLVIFFLCMVMNFIARGHLGVTLVAMTSHKNDTLDIKENITITENNAILNITKEAVDYLEERYESTDGLNITTLDNANVSIGSNNTVESWSVYKTYIWSKPIQEMVLNAFFLGYCLMMFPIALVCQKWGGKVPLQLGLLVNGIVSILTPWLALWGGWQAVCVCRLLQGMSQSGTFPGIQTLLAQWVPINEKATLTSYVYTGATAGCVIAFQIGGLLSHACGWPAAFWVIGLLCLLTFALLTVFGAASPKVHKTISEKEKNYIIGNFENRVVQTTRVPWKAIATSKPLWGNYATTIGSGVSFIFFFTQVPSFIHHIYGIDVQSSGVLSSLPYIASIFASLAFGNISDYLTNKNIISFKNARRISNTFSQAGVAVSLIGASYASTTTVAVFWFTFFMIAHMGIHTGWMVNQIDLSPNFSGTLIAIGNMVSNFFAMVMPFIISNIVIDMENVNQWRIMMYLEAAIAFIPNLIFVFFISTDVQPWNEGYTLEAELKDVKLAANKKDEGKK